MHSIHKWLVRIFISLSLLNLMKVTLNQIVHVPRKQSTNYYDWNHFTVALKSLHLIIKCYRIASKITSIVTDSGENFCEIDGQIIQVYGNTCGLPFALYSFSRLLFKPNTKISHLSLKKCLFVIRTWSNHKVSPIKKPVEQACRSMAVPVQNLKQTASRFFFPLTILDTQSKAMFGFDK